MNLIALMDRALSERPDKTALIIDQHSLSFKQLDRMAVGYAKALVFLGIKPGDRVGLFMGNRVELAGMYLACFRLGAIAKPTSCYNKPAEAEYEVDHCQAKVLIAEPELFPGVVDLADRVSTLEGVYQAPGRAADPAASFDRLVKQTAAGPTPPVHDGKPADPAVILYTSGSTGRPKGVTHTVGSLTRLTENRIAAFGHTEAEVYFISAFLCHGSSLTSVFLPMLSVGGTAVLMRNYSPAGFLEVLRRERPTVVGAAPSHARDIVDQPGVSPADFASIRYFHVGGDAPTRPLFDQFTQTTGLDLSVAMGMTECGGYLLSLPGEPARPGSMGRPIPGTEIRLVDEAGQTLPDNEIGQMIVRTGAMMSGYWNDPTNTEAAIKDGWLWTGDLARRDDDGFYYFVGRCKNIIVHGTSNIAPVAVESVINDHPKVSGSGVTGLPDERYGQTVTALIVAADETDPPDIDDLRRWTAKKLADRKVPERWFIVTGIPLTPMSKIDRKALAALARRKAGLE